MIEVNVSGEYMSDMDIRELAKELLRLKKVDARSKYYSDTDKIDKAVKGLTMTLEDLRTSNETLDYRLNNIVDLVVNEKLKDMDYKYGVENGKLFAMFEIECLEDVLGELLENM